MTKKRLKEIREALDECRAREVDYDDWYELLRLAERMVALDQAAEKAMKGRKDP